MIYENIKRICETKGTSITAVSKAVGLSTSVPNAWKNGRIPRSDQLQLFADYLKVPVSSLLSDSVLPEGINMDLTLFGEPAADKLSPEERHLIDAYRENPTFRAAVDALYTALVPAKKPESSEA